MHFAHYHKTRFGGEIKEYISKLQIPYKVSLSFILYINQRDIMYNV
jgi:hypothetical protein